MLAGLSRFGGLAVELGDQFVFGRGERIVDRLQRFLDAFQGVGKVAPPLVPLVEEVAQGAVHLVRAVDAGGVTRVRRNRDRVLATSERRSRTQPRSMTIWSAIRVLLDQSLAARSELACEVGVGLLDGIGGLREELAEPVEGVHQSLGAGVPLGVLLVPLVGRAAAERVAERCEATLQAVELVERVLCCVLHRIGGGTGIFGAKEDFSTHVVVVLSSPITVVIGVVVYERRYPSPSARDTGTTPREMGSGPAGGVEEGEVGGGDDAGVDDVVGEAHPAVLGEQVIEPRRPLTPAAAYLMHSPSSLRLNLVIVHPNMWAI